MLAFLEKVFDVHATYARALATGGSSLQEPKREPDDDLRVGVRDASGTTWRIGTQ